MPPTKQTRLLQTSPPNHQGHSVLVTGPDLGQRGGGRDSVPAQVLQGLCRRGGQCTVHVATIGRPRTGSSAPGRRRGVCQVCARGKGAAAQTHGYILEGCDPLGGADAGRFSSGALKSSLRPCSPLGVFASVGTTMDALETQGWAWRGVRGSGLRTCQAFRCMRGRRWEGPPGGQGGRMDWDVMASGRLRAWQRQPLPPRRRGLRDPGNLGDRWPPWRSQAHTAFLLQMPYPCLSQSRCCRALLGGLWSEGCAGPTQSWR